MNGINIFSKSYNANLSTAKNNNKIEALKVSEKKHLSLQEVISQYQKGKMSLTQVLKLLAELGVNDINVDVKNLDMKEIFTVTFSYNGKSYTMISTHNSNITNTGNVGNTVGSDFWGMVDDEGVIKIDDEINASVGSDFWGMVDDEGVIKIDDETNASVDSDFGGMVDEVDMTISSEKGDTDSYDPNGMADEVDIKISSDQEGFDWTQDEPMVDDDLPTQSTNNAITDEPQVIGPKNTDNDVNNYDRVVESDYNGNDKGVTKIINSFKSGKMSIEDTIISLFNIGAKNFKIEVEQSDNNGYKTVIAFEINGNTYHITETTEYDKNSGISLIQDKLTGNKEKITLLTQKVPNLQLYRYLSED